MEIIFDDNLKAIDMLKDVTSIIEAIEHDDPEKIFHIIKSLKTHLTEFEQIYRRFLLDGAYFHK